MARLSDEIITILNRVIVKSPYGALIGLEFVDAEEDCAATAAFWASSKIRPGSRGTTIGFAINFLEAGRGRDLVATGRVRRRGRDISTGEVTVCDSDGTEIAFALVTYKLSAPA